MSQIYKPSSSGVATSVTSYTTSGLPSASPADQIAYASDCAWSGGTGCLVVSNGTNWINPNGSIAATTFAGPGLIFSQTADVSVTNTTTATSLVGTGAGSMTIPSAAWAVGKTYQFNVMGLVTTSASPPTHTFTLKLGSTTLWSQASIAITSSYTNVSWWLALFLTCRATGSSGSIVTAETDLKLGSTSFTNTVNPVTVNLTSSLLLDFVATPSVADASTTLKSQIITLLALN